MQHLYATNKFVENKNVATQLLNDVFFVNKSTSIIHIYFTGTPFQKQVWKYLLHIPQGSLTTYQDIAKNIKKNKAYRAVGTAIGNNPLTYIVPCHRVVRNNGHLGGYFGGLDIKEKILLKELL